MTRKPRYWSCCCYCLSWPVTLTACLSAAENRLVPAAFMCCCVAQATRDRVEPSRMMRPLGSSLWANERRTSIAFRADSNSSYKAPGTKQQGFWQWGREPERELGSSTWTGWLNLERPLWHPCLFETNWVKPGTLFKWKKSHFTPNVYFFLLRNNVNLNVMSKF